MHRAGRLLWAAAGFTAAVFGAEYLLPANGLPYIAAALVVLCLPALLLRSWRRRAALLALIFAALGLLSWRWHYDRHVLPWQALVGEKRIITARVTDYPQRSKDYTRLTVKVLSGGPAEKGYIYPQTDTPDLVPGDIITARISVASAALRGGERIHTYTGAGKYFRGYAEGSVTVTGRAEAAWVYFPLRAAHWVQGMCERLFPGDAVPFMKALMTGDKTDLYADTELYSQMRTAGMLHIVAVSGMHILFLVEFLVLILGRSRRTSVLCMAVMAFFVLMTGCSPSVTRAALMESIALMAPILGRERDGPSCLAAALMLLLAIDPMSIGSVALQLSFSSMLGFITLMPAFQRAAGRYLPMHIRPVRAAAGSVCGTICAMAFSLPVAAAYFHAVPLFGIVTNLLTFPAVTVCFCGGYIVCALGAVWFSAGAVGGWLLAWLTRWCGLVFGTVAKVPFACLYTVTPAAVIWLAAVYAMAIGWYILRRAGKRITPFIPAELALIGLCLIIVTDGALGPDAALTVLDVGQGQCVLLTDRNAAVVIDCGGSGFSSAGDLAANRLLAAGKYRVDALVLTHPHADHANGARALISRMPVDRLILPADADADDGVMADVLSAAEKNGTQVIYLADEMTAALADTRLRLMLPQAGTGDNERGIVVLAECAGGKALIMGDAGEASELALLRRGLVPDVDVLVAGHHGSASGSGLLFLRAARAETAVVSVGGNNPYGLPAEDTMERLAENCGAVLRTDRDGTVTIPMRAESYG